MPALRCGSDNVIPLLSEIQWLSVTSRIEYKLGFKVLLLSSFYLPRLLIFLFTLHTLYHPATLASLLFLNIIFKLTLPFHWCSPRLGMLASSFSLSLPSSTSAFSGFLQYSAQILPSPEVQESLICWCLPLLEQLYLFCMSCKLHVVFSIRRYAFWGQELWCVLCSSSDYCSSLLTSTPFYLGRKQIGRAKWRSKLWFQMQSSEN